jgi:hypothetical protein
MAPLIRLACPGEGWRRAKAKFSRRSNFPGPLNVHLAQGCIVRVKSRAEIALEWDQSPSLAQIGSLPGSRGSVPCSGGPAGPGSGGAFPPERQRCRPLRAVRGHALGRALGAGGCHRRSGSAGHIHADGKGVRRLPLLVPPVIHTSSSRGLLAISSLDSSRFAASFSALCTADPGAQPLVQN